MLHLFITASGHYFVGAKDRVRYQKKSHGTTLVQALRNEGRVSPLIHFFLYDPAEGKFYAEIGRPGDVPDMAEFLARGTSGEVWSFPKGRLESEGVALPNTLLQAFPDLLNFLAKRGISAYKPSVPGIKSAVARLKDWERNLSYPFLNHSLAKYEHWKAAACKGSHFVSAMNQADYSSDAHLQAFSSFHNLCKSLAGECPIAKRRLDLIRTEIKVTGSNFVVGRDPGYFIFFSKWDTGYPYAGLDWVLTTNLGPIRVRLFSSERNPLNILGFTAESLPEAVVQQMHYNRPKSREGERYILRVEDLLEVLAGKRGERCEAVIKMIQDGKAMTPLGEIRFFCGDDLKHRLSIPTR